MPYYEVQVPKDSTGVRLRKSGSRVDIPLDVAAMGFTRTGEDGDVIIIPMFGGDEFVGLVLEGHWKKGWTTDMDADQAFTAILDGSGTLEFEGEADVAGTVGFGKIISSHIIPLLDGLEIAVSMQVPIDDTGVTADRDLIFWFILDKLPTQTITGGDNSLRFEIDVDENGLQLVITKEINTVATALAYGYNYTMDQTKSTGDLEGIIWRIVFHEGHYGEASPADDKHIHVYLKQSDTIANAELATENELSTSPYDISDLLFEVAYPTFQIGSQNPTYFDSGGEAKSTYVKVDYQNTRLVYDPSTAADRLTNMVELWDGDPDNGGKKAYDVDHAFSGDAYIQNGLTRIHVDNSVQYGLKLYSYYGASWNQPVDQIRPYLVTSAQSIEYPFLSKIVSWSPEKVVIDVKMCDSATNNDDYFITLRLTLTRGSLQLKCEIMDTYPLQDVRVWFFDSTTIRFGYVGDGEVGDDDLDLDGQNTTMSDNFLISFDDTGEAVLASMSINYKPSTRFEAEDGGDLKFVDIDEPDLDNIVFYFALSPFSLIVNLFEQAEDGSYGTAGTVTDAAADPTAGANNAVQLNAIGNYQTPAGEYSAYVFTAGTHLPAGRYKAISRARYVDVETMQMYVWNDTDDEYRNEENAKVTKTLAVTYGYHSVVFDITDADVIGTDTFAIVAEKTTDDATEIRTDYVLVVPHGDGKNWPQDLSHSALRLITQERRLQLR